MNLLWLMDSEPAWERCGDVNNFDSDIEANGASDDDEGEIYDSTSIPKLQFRFVNIILPPV